LFFGGRGRVNPDWEKTAIGFRGFQLPLLRSFGCTGELIENRLWFQWLAKFFDNATQEPLMR
jgi:hypothetical protein